MKKKTSFFKSIGLGVAAICTLSGGAMLYGSSQISSQGENANAYLTISNETPEFFETSKIVDDYYSFVDADDASTYAKVFFNLEEDEILTGEPPYKFRGTYDDGTYFLIFGIDNINISINGRSLSDFNFTGLIKNYEDRTYEHTTDAAIDNTKTYYVLEGNEYVKVQDPNQADIATYYELTSTAIPYDLPVYPQALDAVFGIDLSLPTITQHENELIFNEQGLVELSISYTVYQAVAQDRDNTKYLNIENTLTGQGFSYSFLLLDKASYLDSADDNSPKINSYNSFDRTNSSLPGYRFNYFNNFSTNEIASLNFDVRNYELSLLKTDEQENTIFNKIVYDPETQSISTMDENGNVIENPEIGVKLDGNSLGVYFYNIGEYSLAFNPIFINGTDVYSIPKQMAYQKAYVFGLQSFYTISSGNYAELKTYDEYHSSFENPADQTYKIDSVVFDGVAKTTTIYIVSADKEKDDTKTYYRKNGDVYEEVEPDFTNNNNTYYEQVDFDSINKVSSNRTPLKFRTLENVIVANTSKCYFLAKDSDEWVEKDFSLVENFMNPGKYIIATTYKFDTYKENDFVQYFTFEITKKPPEVSVFKEDNSTLSDGAYTNENVFISFKDFANIYNKSVRVEIVRYNFLTGTTTKEDVNWTQNGTNYLVENKYNYFLTQDTQIVSGKTYFAKNLNGTYSVVNNPVIAQIANYYEREIEYGTIKVTSDGNYTINLYREDLKNPVQRTFNIDTITEFNLSAYNVERSQISQQYYPGSQVEVLTNQSILFSWDNVKASGATTQGTFKHYNINAYQLYNGNVNNNERNILTSDIILFLEKNVIPVEYKLELNSEASWNAYTNFDYSKNSNQVVNSEYIKSEAGLYIFQTYDIAGNTQTRIYIIDHSTPLFLSQSNSSSEYSLLSQYDTITEDSKIVWSKYKALFIGKENLTNINVNLDLYENRLGELDNDIFLAMQSIINEDKIISKLLLPYENDQYSGYYLTVEIDNDVYFKDYFTDNYKFIKGNELDYSYDIVTSYKIYAIDNEVGTFYKSTTAEDGMYLSVVQKDLDPVYPNPINVHETQLYIVDSQTYIIYYNNEYYLYDATKDQLGNKISVTTKNGKTYYQETELNQVEFIDKEGQYCFLLMDDANTNLANRAKVERYLTFPSAFQYVSITGDKSKLSVTFKYNNRNISLEDSSVVKITTNADNDLSSKTSYFKPTNEDVIYISFVPRTVDESGKVIQVDNVKVTYYEYENAEYFHFDKDNKGLMEYNAYKTLASTPTFETYLYSHGEALQSDVEISDDGTYLFTLNINDNKTSAGYYTITRTYMTNETGYKVEENDDYMIAQYDYYSRTLNAYVDRYNVLTQTETISGTFESYEFRVTIGSKVYSMTYHVFGDYVYFPTDSGHRVLVTEVGGTDQKNAQFTIENTAIDSYNTQDQRYVTGSSGQNYTGVKINNFSTDKLKSGLSSNVESVRVANPNSFTSTQSLVGGSIVVTMYSKYDQNSNVVSVSHPGQAVNEILAYNSGDSFYTRQNTTNLKELSTIFSTNKLPLSIWIPKYKYITYYSTNINLNNNVNYVSHYAGETGSLSYYGYDPNSATRNSITSYELEVYVEYYQNKINETKTPTKVYKSNGTILNDVTSESTNYLALYEYNTSTGEFGTNPVEFTSAGDYYVTITQAPTEVSSSAYNFKNSYSFAFTIEKNMPEFNLYSGTLLKSIANTKSNFYGEDYPDETIPTYYTNKDDISVVWSDSQSVYKSNIDKSNIQVGFGSTNYRLKIEDGNVYIVKNVNNVEIKELTNLFTFSSNETTLTNTLSFNLKNLNITNNGSEVSITMQFEGHNNSYYDKTTKIIVLDKKASNENVGNLIRNVANDKNPISANDLREYYLADSVTPTQDVEKATYNQTISSGIYQNYAYAVNRDYFENLQSFIKNNIDSGDHSNSTEAYFTPVTLKDYNPTSNTYDFVQTQDTIQILGSTVFENNVKEGKYYEVVERDLAGNITIYLVYVIVSDGFDQDKETFLGLHYAEDGVIKDSEIKSGKYEVSSNTNFELSSIDFQGDEWNYFYIMTYNRSLGGYQTSYYLQTPSLEKTYVYRVSGNLVKTYTKENISDLLANQDGVYKSKLYILDRTSGNYNLVTFSLSNTALLTLDVNGTSNSATLSISLPLNILNSDLYISAKPVEVTIKVGDSEVYSVKNNPNDNLNGDYSYINGFTSENNVEFSYDNSNLKFSLSNLAKDTRVTFTVTDNFGKQYSEIYLVGETKVDEITSNGNLYTYNTLINNEFTTMYITSDDIVFSYNTNKYNPIFYDMNGREIKQVDYERDDGQDFYIQHGSIGAIDSFTFASDKYQCDSIIRIALYDKNVQASEDDPIKSYYIRLYRKLPYKNEGYFIMLTNSNGIDDTAELIRPKRASEEAEYIKVNGKTYEVYSSTQTFSDEIKVTYKIPSDLDFPYEVKYISFEDFWKNGEDFVPLESGAKLDQNGVFYILVKYTHQSVLTQEYYLFKIDVLGSSGEHYYILADGIRREKANVYYKDGSSETSAYYIVNINYQDRSIKEKFEIVTNNYQQVKAYELPNAIFEGPGIYTYKYLITNYTGASYTEPPSDVDGIIPYYQTIYVTFLTPTNDILSVLTGSTSYLSYKTNDTAETFVTSATKEVKVIIYDDSTGTDSMIISWAKSYGIDSNEIDLVLEKDGRKVSVTKKSIGNYFYTTLSRSGSYNLKFVDTAMNVQSFNAGKTSLPLVFIKDAHFTVSYVNPLTEEEVETEVINKAVYNSTVTLKLNKLLIPYYQTSYFGSGDIITAKRNGEDYTDYEFSSQDYSFTFSELGYYEVYMTAYNQTASASKQIRTEKYSFSIISAKESRYAYNFSGYQTYYIKSIVKNGVDVTNALFKSLKTSSNTILVGNEHYLRNILISYFDQKTGSGRYQITICANDMLYLDNNEEMACFTFEFFINSKPVPIVVSVAEGSSTSKTVSVKFNAKNIYDSVGECYVVVGVDTYLVDETTIEAVELILGDNERRGDHYIEVRTMSGNLLYSYKVTLTEPMNAWAIIAIVAGSIAAVAVLFIIIKLRKRMGVK